MKTYDFVTAAQQRLEALRPVQEKVREAAHEVEGKADELFDVIGKGLTQQVEHARQIMDVFVGEKRKEEAQGTKQEAA